MHTLRIITVLRTIACSLRVVVVYMHVFCLARASICRSLYSLVQFSLHLGCCCPCIKKKLVNKPVQPWPYRLQCTYGHAYVSKYSVVIVCADVHGNELYYTLLVKHHFILSDNCTIPQH